MPLIVIHEAFSDPHTISRHMKLQGGGNQVIAHRTGINTKANRVGDHRVVTAGTITVAGGSFAKERR